jgi:two-component system response regulator AlgR
MRIVVADDEQLARRRLVDLVGRCQGRHEIVAEAANGREVLRACAGQAVDLVLLDIRMPGMDGLEAALALGERPAPPAVVFVSAYGEHALAAFEVNAIDYLLKPVRVDRLQRALDKAAVLDPRQLRALGEQRPFVTASYRGGLARIAAADIAVLRADAKYVEVWHDARLALTEESLKSIEERLPASFLRVHRNALVAPDRVRQLRKSPDGRLLLQVEGCSEPIEVSRRHAAAVRRLLRGDP